MLKLLPDNPILHTPSQKVKLDRGRQIARTLFNWIENYNKNHKSKQALGLAANQLGIDASVCVVTLPNLKMSFVNPKIIERSFQTIRWQESCLSYPRQEVETTRNIWIKVAADNLPSQMIFGIDQTRVSGKSYGNVLLECVCVTHEIEHTMGLTIFDAAAKS